MRILFSVFKEDIIDGKIEKKFEEMVETKASISEIDPLFDINDGFQSIMFVGKTLSFWDIYCFHNQEQTIIKRIKSITREKCSKKPREKEPLLLLLNSYGPGDSKELSYPDPERCYFYQLSRFECGASGFGEIISYIKEDPVLASFIGGVLIEFIRIVVNLFRKNNKINSKKKPAIIFLDVGNLKNCFSKITEIKKKDIQIVALQKFKKGKYVVNIRTASNSKYEVVTNRKGVIQSLQQLPE